MAVPHGPRLALILFIYDLLEIAGVVGFQRKSRLTVFSDVLCGELIKPPAIMMWATAIMVTMESLGSFENS